MSEGFTEMVLEAQQQLCDLQTQWRLRKRPGGRPGGSWRTEEILHDGLVQLQMSHSQLPDLYLTPGGPNDGRLSPSSSSSVGQRETFSVAGGG